MIKAIMLKETLTMNRISRLTLGLACLCLLVAPLAAKEKLPETTTDGLHLIKQDNVSAVYVKPGATLDAYTKVMLVDAYVAFEKNWERDYNDDQIGLGNRINAKEMQKITTEVAAEFKKVFTKVLEKGGYEIVTEAGPDVMIVRPALINMRISAPDLPTAGMQTTVVRSAGSVTLYAELYDSATNAKFAEVIDAEEVGGEFAQVANRVTNQAALDRTLDRWATLLRKRLDEAHGKTK